MKQIAESIFEALWYTLMPMLAVILVPLLLVTAIAIPILGIELLISLIPTPPGGEH